MTTLPKAALEPLDPTDQDLVTGGWSLNDHLAALYGAYGKAQQSNLQARNLGAATGASLRFAGKSASYG